MGELSFFIFPWNYSQKNCFVNSSKSFYYLFGNQIIQVCILIHYRIPFMHSIPNIMQQNV